MAGRIVGVFTLLMELAEALRSTAKKRVDFQHLFYSRKARTMLQTDSRAHSKRHLDR
jgi:hypothetical protein